MTRVKMRRLCCTYITARRSCSSRRPSPTPCGVCVAAEVWMRSEALLDAAGVDEIRGAAPQTIRPAVPRARHSVGGIGEAALCDGAAVIAQADPLPRLRSRSVRTPAG